MENKFINRYHTFCRSLKNLEKSRYADPSADFVLEGTVLNFNLTFDISWKVMKDILIKKLEILDFAVGSPRETLQQSFKTILSQMTNGSKCSVSAISLHTTMMAHSPQNNSRI